MTTWLFVANRLKEIGQVIFIITLAFQIRYIAVELVKAIRDIIISKHRR